MIKCVGGYVIHRYAYRFGVGVRHELLFLGVWPYSFSRNLSCLVFTVLIFFSIHTHKLQDLFEGRLNHVFGYSKIYQYPVKLTLSIHLQGQVTYRI